MRTTCSKRWLSAPGAARLRSRSLGTRALGCTASPPNVCLDELGRRRNRCLPFEAGPPSPVVRLPAEGADREAWIEPCPDTWSADVATNPEARYQASQGVTLAFIAALQHLTATQRATLLLRDVVGLSAAETAQALELSLEASNSALFSCASGRRAEASGQGAGTAVSTDRSRFPVARPLPRSLERAARRRLRRALARRGADHHAPFPMWIAGRIDNAAFYRPMFAAQRRGTFVALPTAWANAQPAVAFYRELTPGKPHQLTAIQLVELRDEHIVGIESFPVAGARTHLRFARRAKANTPRIVRAGGQSYLQKHWPTAPKKGSEHDHRKKPSSSCVPTTTAGKAERSTSTQRACAACSTRASSFESPASKRDNLEDCLPGIQRFGSTVRAHRMLQMFASGNEAAAIYDCDLTAPVDNLRLAEFFRVEGDRICSIRLIFDASAYKAKTAA